MLLFLSAGLPDKTVAAVTTKLAYFCWMNIISKLHYISVKLLIWKKNMEEVLNQLLKTDVDENQHVTTAVFSIKLDFEHRTYEISGSTYG